MRIRHLIFLAWLTLPLVGCEQASNWAIQRSMFDEVRIGATRDEVELWCLQRMIPYGVLPAKPKGAPAETQETLVAEMGHTGRFFERDVHVYYYLGRDNRLVGLEVRSYSEAVFESLEEYNHARNGQPLPKRAEDSHAEP